MRLYFPVTYIQRKRRRIDEYLNCYENKRRYLSEENISNVSEKSSLNIDFNNATFYPPNVSALKGRYTQNFDLLQSNVFY